MVARFEPSADGSYQFSGMVTPRDSSYSDTEFLLLDASTLIVARLTDPADVTSHLELWRCDLGTDSLTRLVENGGHLIGVYQGESAGP